jgi:catechol-2,3-dioxygenase
MYPEVRVSRIQLALNVSDLEASVAFYSQLFAAQPHKRRPGYANFAIGEPPLKLVLIEVPADQRGSGVVGALNHLGVEVESTAEVDASAARLAEAGLATFGEHDTTCCYALQDKVWVQDPAGAPWEVYTVKDDNPANPRDGHDRPLDGRSGDGNCCVGPSTGAPGRTGAATSCC